MKKKKYRKPEVIYKEKIEARAASCSGNKSGPGTCTVGPYVS
jgi:hypothetical protein